MEVSKMGIKDELKKMTSAIFGDGESPSTEVPSTESVVTETPSTDAPTTDLPEEFETDAPSTESVVTEAPTTELPDESTQLRAELETLKNELSELKNPKQPDPTQAPSTEAPISDENFLDGVDLDDLTRDPDALNELLNKVYKKGLSIATNIAKDGSANVLNNIPGIVNTEIHAIKELTEASDKFYSDNEDLEPFKQVVSTVFGEVVSANPDKTITENLALTGDEVRSRLKIVKKDPAKPPKLPKSKGKQRKTITNEPKGLVSEIDAMNKVI